MGMLYTALWYYPIIMVGAGVTTLVWDLGYPQKVGKVFRRQKPREDEKKRITSEDLEQGSWFNSSRSSAEYDKPLPPPPPAYSTRGSVNSEFAFRHPRPVPQPPTRYPPANPQHDDRTKKPPVSSTSDISSMSWPLGTSIIVFFLITFILTITLHAIFRHTTQAFSLFSSLYLAGTIIFGGGPVVIPLLREYIVSPGWVSPRDFLLGLAVIQAFPGPNFNFAVYLGSLAVAGTPVPSYLGALIAFVAMYAPGLFIVVGFMGLWRILRDKAWFLAILRGVNAAAVGLVFTAVYKLWQIGYLTAEVQGGSPLGTDPWLVAITGTAFVGGAWFRMSPPVAILLGGAMGMGRYGIFSRWGGNVKWKALWIGWDGKSMGMDAGVLAFWKVLNSPQWERVSQLCIVVRVSRHMSTQEKRVRSKPHISLCCVSKGPSFHSFSSPSESQYAFTMSPARLAGHTYATPTFNEQNLEKFLQIQGTEGRESWSHDSHRSYL